MPKRTVYIPMHGTIVLREDNARANLNQQFFRRKTSALKRENELFRTAALHVKCFCFAGQLFQLSTINLINIRIVAVQLRDAVPWFREVARAQKLAMRFCNRRTPHRREKFQKYDVFLAVLFGEITYEGIERVPCGGEKCKLCACSRFGVDRC